MIKKSTKSTKSHIIASLTCTGKSFCAKRHPSLVLDLEAMLFKYQCQEHDIRDIEKLKGTLTKSSECNFPSNYIEAVKQNIGKYPFILVTLNSEILECLEKEKIPYDIVVPTADRSSELVANAEKRGSAPEFIYFIESWTSVDNIKKIQKQFHPVHFDFLERHEYLNGYLQRKYPECFENETNYQPLTHDSFIQGGEKYELDFYDLTDCPLPNYPWDQIYAIGNLDGKIPIVKYAKNKDNLPGGGIKIGETIEQALQREMREELNMTAADWHPIGYQRVYDENGNESFQLRVYAILKKLGEFEKDPGGSVIGYELIDIKDLNKHINYGDVGEFLMQKWQEQN